MWYILSSCWLDIICSIIHWLWLFPSWLAGITLRAVLGQGKLYWWTYSVSSLQCGGWISTQDQGACSASIISMWWKLACRMCVSGSYVNTFDTTILLSCTLIVWTCFIWGIIFPIIVACSRHGVHLWMDYANLLSFPMFMKSFLQKHKPYESFSYYHCELV